MPIMYNTGEWFTLRPDMYRRFDLDTFVWPYIEWEYMKVCAAPYGGPIAVVRDPQQFVPIRGTAKLKIQIFDSAHSELSVIEWNHGKLLTMGWSDTEELICIQDEAIYYVYDIFGKEKNSQKLSQEANITRIIDAKVFQSLSGTGIAVFTTGGRIFIKMNYSKDGGARQLPEIPKSNVDCSCWEIITEERNSYCLLGRAQEVIKLFPGDAFGDITRNLFEKPFERIIIMTVSINHRYLALYTNNGLLWMGTVDMQQKFCEFDTGHKDTPKQIEWIMNTDNDDADAVVIAYTGTLLFVHRNGDQLDSPQERDIFLVSEIDGVRVITNTTHEIIQKVPKSVHNVFAINSFEPSTFLLQAQRKFREKSHESDDYLNMCRDKLRQAVDECIEAASHEFDTETQKTLLQTAYFGKGFISNYNPDNYISLMRILRVLNTLRNPRIAMTITYKQFLHLRPETIISRLVFRRQYPVALQIAKHLKLSENWIYEHWAYDKVINDKDDIEVARKIAKKFKNPSIEGISFCNIAEKAYNVKRNNLALKLLELEPRTSLQVPLLLKLSEFDRAILCATQCGDIELLTDVLLQIKSNMANSNFHMLIRKYPMALNNYKKIMNEWSPTALYDIYKDEDDHKTVAEIDLRNAVESKTLETFLSIIGERYTRGRKQTEADLCADALNMMKLQKTLNTKYANSHGSVNFSGMSIHDTMLQLLRIGEIKEAEKIKYDFKVPDRRYWWLRIRSLSEKYKWEELEKFSKSKKSPIGYDPFVEVCLQQRNLTEARKYIMKCRSDRIAYWFIRAGLYEEAINRAFEQRDLDTLITIKPKINDNRALTDKLNGLIELLSARK